MSKRKRSGVHFSESDIARLPKHIQEAIRDTLARAPRNTQPCEAHAREGTNCVHPMATPVCVRIHQKRRRLGDAVDGYDSKPCVDGLVRAGLLPDDTPMYIPQPARHTHQLCQEGEEEETVITIEAM